MSAYIWKKNGAQIKVGDIVNHVLYGREWIGIVVRIEVIEGAFHKERRRALICMVPGSEYELYFEKAFSRKEGVRRGWVTTNWLMKHETEKENS
jgi:hypothetical protein